MRDAADGYVRVIVHVPEAYALLGPCEASRPGLLVLDADARRVDAVDLAPEGGSAPGAAEVAKRLRDAAKAPAIERSTIRVVSDDAAAAGRLREILTKIEGVRSVVVDKDRLVVAATTGALPPDAVERAASAAKATAEVLEPVPVSFVGMRSADANAARLALAELAGTWYATTTDGEPRAWVAALLLDPARIDGAAKGFTCDVEARRFAVPGVSLGPSGMKVPAAARGVPGVLSVIPSLALGSVTVVGRRDVASWPAVLAALRATGLDARPSDR